MESNSETGEEARLAERLDRFFSLFHPTIQLADSLIRSKANSQEVVLLLCARLDALASCLASEGQTNRKSFISLLVNYGGHRDLMQSVSVGDLYYELGYHRWLASRLVPKPGRLHRFSRLNDPFISLLDRSGIPLTVEAVERLFTRLMRALAANFRCRPGQRISKPRVAKPQVVTSAVLKAFEKSRDIESADRLREAIQPIIDIKTVANLLYENYRNNAIHGAWVGFDDKAFFSQTKPYWEPLYSPYYPPFMFVKFPAAFLVELTSNCMGTLKRKMIATRKLPPDVHYHAFGPGTSNLEFLDYGLLPKGEDLRIQIK